MYLRLSGVHQEVVPRKAPHNFTLRTIRESPPQFENRIMARVYVRSITRSTMYQKAPFCWPELAYGK